MSNLKWHTAYQTKSRKPKFLPNGTCRRLAKESRCKFLPWKEIRMAPMAPWNFKISMVSWDKMIHMASWYWMSHVLCHRSLPGGSGPDRCFCVGNAIKENRSWFGSFVPQEVLKVGSSFFYRIHGTGIFTYIWLIFVVNVGKYTNTRIL